MTRMCQGRPLLGCTSNHSLSWWPLVYKLPDCSRHQTGQTDCRIGLSGGWQEAKHGGTKQTPSWLKLKRKMHVKSLVWHFYPSCLVKNLSHFVNQSGAGRNWSSLVPSRFPRLPLRTTGFELWLVHFDVCMLLLCRPKIVLIIKVRISYKRGKVRKEMFKSL